MTSLGAVGACEWVQGIRDTGAFIQSTISLQGSRIRSQTWPREPQNRVFWPHQPPPLLPSHTCQGGCPQWSWGSDPPGGTSRFRQQPLLPDLHLAERKEEGAAGKGPGSQHSMFPVSALGDYARRHRTSDQRETPSGNVGPRFLPL